MDHEALKALESKVTGILESCQSDSFREVVGTLSSLMRALAGPLSWCTSEVGLVVTGCCPTEGISYQGFLDTFPGKARIQLFTTTLPNTGYPFTINFTFRPGPYSPDAPKTISSKEELEAAFFEWLSQPPVKTALSNLRLTGA